MTSFRTYLNLESLKKNLAEAVETGDFPDKIFAFLSTASVSFDERNDWRETIKVFLDTVSETQPNPNLPLVKDSTNNKREKPVSWDWEGRNWFYWSNLFAKAYGWNLESIANLEMNDALALAQEILTDDQLDREFVYSLSEVAYPWNKSLKKGVFKPLTRPYWMKMSVSPMKTMKYRRDDLPVGLVQDFSGMPSEYNPLRDTAIQSSKPAQ